MNDLEQQILGLINHDYSHTTFDTRLYELFCKEDEFVKAYIKVGRKFWYYDAEKMYWRKLTVTYIRTGVMFFEKGIRATYLAGRGIQCERVLS